MPETSASQRGLVGLQVGREAALVAHGRREPRVVQRALERVEDLGARAQRLGEARRAHRHDHELLEVDLVVGVGAAVEHVHHRHGQHVRGLAAEVAPQRQPGLRRGRLRGRQRDAEDRVRAEPGLVGGAVELDHRPVDARPGRRRRRPAPPAPARRSRSPPPASRPCRPTPRRRRAARRPRTRRSTRPTAPRRARRRRTSAARRPRRSGCRGCRRSAARAPSRSRSSSLSTSSLNRSAACRRASSGSTPASTASRTAASSRSPCVLPLGIQSKARALCALEHLLRVERRRQVVGQLAEDRPAALVVALDLVPGAHHVAGRLGLAIAEHVRMAADQLRAHVLGHAGQAALRRAPRAAATGSRPGRARRRARRRSLASSPECAASASS